MRLTGVVAYLRPCANALLRLGRMFPSSLLAMLWWPLCFPSFVHALGDLRLIHATTFMAQVKTAFVRSPYFINFVRFQFLNYISNNNCDENYNENYIHENNLDYN